MSLDLLTFGEALVEMMRTGIDQPLDRPALFTGPYPSGAPFIFTVQAARLGAQAGCIGAVGDDWFGKCQLDQLRADGVDLRGVHTLKDYTTGVAFIAYNADGSRDFVFHARHAAAGQISDAMLDPELFTGLKCLHITGSSLSMHDAAYAMGVKALAMGQTAGAMISFDPNIRPQLMSPERAREAFAPFVAAADVILTTNHEALLLTNTQTLDAAVETLLHGHPQRVIVVHQGKDGCAVYTSSGTTVLPSFKVEEIDPTGAGDCFDAGFLVRWLAGDPPADAARFGNACGALAVTAQGPMAGAKTFAEVQAFMALAVSH
jgi:sugar/nucleoside kinase (ribokinase family)